MSDSLQILINRPDLALAHYDRICIAIPRGTADPDLVRDIRRAMEALAKAGDKKIGLLFIVAETSSTPNGAAREEAGAMFDALRPYLKVVAAQMEGSGFTAAAKRSVFTWATSNMLGKTPVKTFARIGETARWLADKCRELEVGCPAPDALERAVRQMHDAK